MFKGLLRLVSGVGRLLVPVGLFAVIAVGLHAGADRVDDYARLAIDALDARMDAWGAQALSWLFDALEVGPKRAQRWVFGFIDFVDLDARDWMARATALMVELLADLILALPLFFHRHGQRTFKQKMHDVLRDPTLLRILAPVAALLASVAGVLTICRELQVLLHALVEDLSGLPRLAELVASVCAGLVLVLVLSRLMTRIVLGALSWADRVSEKDRSQQRPTWRRRLRGWGLAVLVVPVTLLAVVEAVPLLPTLRALFVVS